MMTPAPRLKTWLRQAAVVLVAAALPLTASAGDNAPETLTIGYQKANIMALLKSRGTLDQALESRGIHPRWIEFTAGPSMLEALNVGSIDLAATGDAPPILAQAAQADLVYLAHGPANPKTEAIVVPAHSDIQSVADLKGRRVALNKGSDVNYLLIQALAREGLAWHDITPVYLKPGDARAAFAQGSVDAWVIWDPYYAEVELRGQARKLADATDLVPHYTFFLASRTLAEQHPETAELVIDTLTTLGQWANDHPEETADSLARASGLDVDIWQRAIARMPFGAERMSDELFREQQTLADTFRKTGLIPVDVQVDQARWAEDAPTP